MAELEIINPYNLEVFDKIPMQSEVQAMKAMENAYALVENRRKALPPKERIQILEKTHEILSRQREKIIETAAKEGGKPYRDTEVEVDRGFNGIKVAIEAIPHTVGREIPMNIDDRSMGRMAYTLRQARGLVVSVSAFNHPFNLAIHQIIPAIATGCPVIIKPASTTPLSAKFIVDALHEAGLPKGYCHYIVCENEVAEKMVTDKRTAFLSFIGSAKVGWHLRSKLSAGTTCALEHGGAAPVIVDETANLKDAIPAITKAGYYHAGQVCVSAQRIYVHKNIKSEFVESYVAEVRKLKVGDPLEKSSDLGPLILPRENDRVAQWVDEAKTGGAEVITGGRKLSDSCYEPTVLLNPKEDAKVSTQEIFGPVTCVYDFKDLDDAIDRANSLDFAFQASIFSSDIHRALQAVEELEALAVMVNDHPAFRVDWMPFGGYKDSGLGVGGIINSMEDMSIEKLMVIKRS